MIHILKFNEGGEVKREEFSDREALDDRIAELVLQGRCCVVVPKREEAKVVVLGVSSHHLILGPASGARFLQITPRTKMPRE